MFSAYLPHLYISRHKNQRYSAVEKQRQQVFNLDALEVAR